MFWRPRRLAIAVIPWETASLYPKTMIQPKTLADETLAALNALINESDRWRDWTSAEVQALIRTAEKLQRVDARVAFVHLGSVAAICGELDRLVEFYTKALR